VLAEAAQGADLFAAEACSFDRPIRYRLDYQTLRAHLVNPEVLDRVHAWPGG